MDIEDRRYKCCGNCSWKNQVTETGGCVCGNSNSRYYSLWISDEHKCDEHKWNENP